MYAAVATNGSDLVGGFEPGTDKLDLRALGLNSFAEVQQVLRDDPDGDANIFTPQTLDGVILIDVSAAQLSADDFIF